MKLKGLDLLYAILKSLYAEVRTFVCHTEEFGLYSESSEEPWLDFH